ncbi:Imelysin [Synechococcus sp. PCC 7502]|uniref:imelysin family protein n=1 Tax=Synechococcus sp. PCC 7502 TaxID=1173263 RepID=UPI00029FDA2F|nr:imelysin family protein [Synechococcus sp. PCC 7502]AFY72350.1 Imelysin [Synechococcus sp. PCC 7502]
MNFNKAIIKAIGLGVVVCALAIACTSPSTISNNSNTGIESNRVSIDQYIDQKSELKFKQVAVDFADQVVIPTYTKFTAKTTDLKIAVDKLAKSPTADNLKLAQSAWMSARVYWEQGESFTIGPAKSFGLDAAIDTWPLDQGDMQKVLNSSTQLTPATVHKLQESQKGYHAIEFMLFGANGKKAISNFTPRELQYLQALATVLDQDGQLLLTAWTKGVDDKSPYRDSFATAGDNPVYPSLTDAVQEMIEGIIDSTKEVAENKIGEPFAKKDTSLIESQYAIANPLNDFRNNILCVQNVYFGNTETHILGKSGLSAYVASVNPQLDARVDREIQAALEAIAKIPAPFYQAIADPKAAPKIKQAIDAVATLNQTFEKEVKPLIVNS